MSVDLAFLPPSPVPPLSNDFQSSIPGFVEEYVQYKTLKPSTVSVYRRQMKNAFKMWLHLLIVDITKNMVADRHKRDV